MKVLFVSHYNELYGANRSLLNIASKLKEYNIEPIVLSRKESEFTLALSERKIKYYCVNFYCNALKVNETKIIHYMKITAKFFLNLYYIIKIIAIVNKEDIDVIHSNSMCTSIGALTSRITRKPHVWHIREYMESDYNTTVLDTPLQKYLYKSTNKFIAISNDVKNKYEDRVGREKIKVIYNGVDFIESALFEKSEETFIFVLVGSISEAKGTRDAIEAFINLCSINSNEIELWIIGGGLNENNSYTKSILELINKQQEDIQSKIKFLGFCKNVNDILKKAHVGLMCSKAEAFGRVTIEYMLNRLAVIGTNSGGTKEIINNEINGFLYDPGDINQLTKFMELLINDKLIYDRIKINGFKIARVHFTTDVCVQNIHKLYRKILDNNATN